jgi:hypothetical protein
MLRTVFAAEWGPRSLLRYPARSARRVCCPVARRRMPACARVARKKMIDRTSKLSVNRQAGVLGMGSEAQWSRKPT